MGVYGWVSGCSLKKHALTDYHAMDVNDQRSISDRPHNDQWVGGWVGVVVWGGGGCMGRGFIMTRNFVLNTLKFSLEQFFLDSYVYILKQKRVYKCI